MLPIIFAGPMILDTACRNPPDERPIMSTTNSPEAGAQGYSSNPLGNLTPQQQNMLISAIGRNWWVLLGLGIVSAVVGIVLITRPAGSVWFLAVILAIYLILSGIFSIVRGFASGLPGSMRAILIVGGGIGVFLGLLMFRFGPDEKIEILGIFVAIWFLFAGIEALFTAAAVASGRGWQIFNGVVYLLAGIVLLASPYAVEVFAWVAGIWLVVIGLFQVITSFRLKSAAAKAQSAL